MSDMTSEMIIMICIFSGLVLYWGISLIVYSKIRGKSNHDEIHYAATGDGMKLAMFRYKPSRKNKSLPPVILCHGFACNRFSFDLNGISLASYLKNKGYDTWVLELRGSGMSDKGKGKGWFSFNFDTYVDYDVDAAIACVCEETGAKKVDWIGHSMGGMIMYAYQGLYGRGKIRKFVSIASPFSMHMLSEPIKLLSHLRILIWPIRCVFLRFYIAINTIFFYLQWPKVRHIVNHKNLPEGSYSRIMTNCFDNFSSDLSIQYGRWIAKKKFDRDDKENYFDYLHGFAQVKLPMLFCVGNGDHFIKKENTRTSFDITQSTKKVWMEFGKETGCAEDYGHMDLVLGKNAEKEVFPEIFKWLKS